MAIDLSKFNGTLPYDSQQYGIYQPLLGWRSAQQTRRLRRGLGWTRGSYLLRFAERFEPKFSIGGESMMVGSGPSFDLAIAEPRSMARSPIVPGIDGLVVQHVVQEVEAAGDDPEAWRKYTTPEALVETLSKVRDTIPGEFRDALRGMGSGPLSEDSPIVLQVLGAILARESIAAGVLVELGRRYGPEQLGALLRPLAPDGGDISAILGDLDPAQSDMTRAALSPIGVVHLFREYFFEFATFLGPPVQHVWLSPGGTVELVEISTRRSTVERTLEQSLESVQKSEKGDTTQDELSEAVKQENASDTKLGVSASATANYNGGFVSGSATVSGSYSLDQQQKQAREQTHKSTRQQTQKLSSEIRQSFKSTLKTVTETTDMTSKRYLLQNTTDKLVNYELRRKMRQVGVQLQDYGTRLCWQAYVENPGDTLGVPIFVHAAPPPNLQNIKVPEAPPAPPALVRGEPIVIRGKWDHGDDTQWNFVPTGAASIVAPPGFVYHHAELTVQQGPGWGYRVWPGGPTDTSVQIGRGPLFTADPEFITTVGSTADDTSEPSVIQVLAGVVTGPSGLTDSEPHDIALQITPIFKPSRAGVKATNDAYVAAKTKYNELTKQAYQESLFASIRERVKLASNIQPRDFGEMREEERIVVYRRLVEQLLKVAGITDTDPHVRHVFSEVVQSMFDMDSMLYFVAPDWWMPRAQVTSSDALSGLGVDNPQGQSAFIPSASGGASGANVVGWGGARSVRPDDYYITDESARAKLGSSLGWLLQLDGDNFRNAFLNAPWVKAVIPIQEGHEWKALDWLRSDNVEGADGLDALYQETAPGEIATMLGVMRAYTDWPTGDLGPHYATLDPKDFTVLDAVRYLIVAIQSKHVAAQSKVTDPDEPSLSYLPTDTVYEHGFDPLQGGFVAQAKSPFEIFDQWIEVLPTDQLVPVEVSYDPKTGQQL
jgi:hypothetical protein